ncbi:MAG: hypothetical protein ACRDQ7_12225, partial [Haloechinothrix sp.]
MGAVGAYLLVGRGEFERAEAVVNDLRAQWRTDVQIAMTAGAVGAELSEWRGDHADPARRPWHRRGGEGGGRGSG